MKYYKAFSTKPDPDNSAFIIDDLNSILNSLQTDVIQKIFHEL